MSESTRIRLPRTVKSDQLAKVIAATMGAPFQKVSLIKPWEENRQTQHGERPASKFEAFDPTLPSSSDNPWYLRCDEKNRLVSFQKQPTPDSPAVFDDLSHFWMEFRDAADQKYSWPLSPEGDLEYEQVLLPDTCALAAAVGIRVVRFFGGIVQINGYDEEPQLQVSPRQALFPPQKTTQTADQRWHQFYNALAKTAPLTAAELAETSKLAPAHWSAENAALFERLRVLELERTMESTLPLPRRTTAVRRM